MKIAIIAPAHIPLTKDWITSLQREAKAGNADVIIVDDSNGSLGELPEEWKVYNYPKQEEFLEELYIDFANIFHKSSACRIFGHIVAYAEGYDVVIGLDSDCIVPFFFVEKHISILNNKKGFGWSNPLGGNGIYPRGFPYSMRNWNIVANMGMWDNVLDLNGKDRRKDEPKRVNAPGYNIAPAPVPFSGMNFSLTREALFGFLFLPNFKCAEGVNLPDNDFRRIDDIWGGYIFQKLLHQLRLGVSYGQPVVFHDTVVVAEEDAAEEEAMYKYEDEFMKEIDSLVVGMPECKTVEEAMSYFANRWIEFILTGQFVKLTPAFQWWLKIIKKYGK